MNTRLPLIALVIILTACSNTPLVTVTSEVTVTLPSLPTMTDTPVPAPTMAEIPLETTLDFTPAYDTGVVEVQVAGVPVNFQIMTADNLDGKGIGAVKINDSKVTQWNQERSEAALGEFTLKMLYEVWQARGGAEGRGGDKGVSFEQFAGMIAAGDVDGTKMRLTNVYQMGAEEPMRELWIAPFAPEGADTGEVTAIRNVLFVWRNVARTEGMTVLDQGTGLAMKKVVNMGTKTLIIEIGLGSYGNSGVATTTGRFTKVLSTVGNFLGGQNNFRENRDLRFTISLENGYSCFSGAIVVEDSWGRKSEFEQKCNP